MRVVLRGTDNLSRIRFTRPGASLSKSAERISIGPGNPPNPMSPWFVDLRIFPGAEGGTGRSANKLVNGDQDNKTKVRTGLSHCRRPPWHPIAPKFSHICQA